MNLTAAVREALLGNAAEAQQQAARRSDSRRPGVQYCGVRWCGFDMARFSSGAGAGR